MKRNIRYAVGALVVAASLAVLKTCLTQPPTPQAAPEGPAAPPGNTLDSMYQEGTDKAIRDMIKQR